MFLEQSHTLRTQKSRLHDGCVKLNLSVWPTMLRMKQSLALYLIFGELMKSVLQPLLCQERYSLQQGWAGVTLGSRRAVMGWSSTSHYKPMLCSDSVVSTLYTSFSYIEPGPLAGAYTFWTHREAWGGRISKGCAWQVYYVVHQNTLLSTTTWPYPYAQATA